MVKLQDSILRTLSYADVFDYPLNQGEIRKFLLGKSQIINSKLHRLISQPLSEVSKRQGFFFLRGRGEIVAIRKQRERWSQKKLEIVGLVARRIRLIPWVKMIALTGALSMKNSTQDDDIDLMIVAARNRLWLTRLLTVILIELMGNRRRPGDRLAKDKICLNMFLDEDHLTIPQKEQDLFTAHEVVQLKLLWERDGVYNRFIKENLWVKKFMHNAFEEKKSDLEADTSEADTSGVARQRLASSTGGPRLLRGGEKRESLWDYLEKLLMKFQILYMSRRRTTEIVEPGRILFHPQDARSWVLKEYRKRLKKLDLE